ncbi:response regulator transcription factor [Arthrobacter sp. 260]|nr:response regulator transcription factor [Arthrobacter sp. 260]
MIPLGAGSGGGQIMSVFESDLDIGQTVAIKPTTVLIIDDHATFAELLAGALNREEDLLSVGFACSVAAGIALWRDLLPDVVVMDFHLPDGTGITAAERILAEQPQTRIIMLTGDPTPEALERAAGIGICAFLPKDGSLAIMLDTLRHARRGSMVVHPTLLAQLVERRRARINDVPVPYLTPREMEVLCRMAEGSDVKASSVALGISQNTCRGHVKTILAKLGAHSQLEAVVTARKLGLLSAYQAL